MPPSHRLRTVALLREMQSSEGLPHAEVDISILGPEVNSQKGAPKLHVTVVEGAPFGTFEHNFCFTLENA